MDAEGRSRAKAGARVLWGIWFLFLMLREADHHPVQSAILLATAAALFVLFYFARKQNPESPVLIFTPLIIVGGLTLALMLGSLELLIWLSISAIVGAVLLWWRSRKTARLAI